MKLSEGIVDSSDGHTAADDGDNVQVLLGEHDLYTDTEAASVRADVAELLIHPQYEADTNNYDVALVSGEPLGSLQHRLHSHISL